MAGLRMCWSAKSLALPGALVQESPELVEFQSVTKCYGSVRALDRVSMTLQPGQPVAVLGANGTGKTTFLRLLVRPDESRLGGTPKRKQRFELATSFVPEPPRARGVGLKHRGWVALQPARLAGRAAHGSQSCPTGFRRPLERAAQRRDPILAVIPPA
jgi:hypothetical protein